MLFRTLLSIFFLLFLSISVFAQDQYTIPKKHRVIQESSTDSRDVQVDTKLANVDFTALTEKTYRLDELLKLGPVAFIFLSAECPVAQRYAMRLKRMHAEYQEKGLTIVGVYANENDSVQDVKAYLAKAEYTFPIVKDTDGSLARHLGATMTPQAHLIDTSGTLRYRGPIDDNRYITRVKHEYLKDALRAVLEGKPVPIKEAPAFGCTIHLPDLPMLTEINYSEHIAPIIQKNCQSCHHEVGIAPLPLEDYEDVKAYADKIREQTQARLMPPWRIVSDHGDFKNERRLTESEIELIANWVRTGAASGSIDSDSLKGQSPKIWTLGKPDVIVNTNIVYKSLPKGKQATIKAHIDTAFAKDMYIRGIDFQSENSKTVRRIIASIRSKANSDTTLLKDNNGTGRKTINGSKNNFEFRIGNWTIGIQPTVLPDKIGYLLPKGAKITLNILYQGTNREQHDTLKTGLYLSDSPDTSRTYKATLSNNVINGKDNSEKQNEVISYHFKEDSYVFAVEPQMLTEEHEIKIVAITPTDEQIKMIWFKESLFDWLDVYHYQEPIFLPAGTQLVFEYGAKAKQNPFVLHFYFTKASEYVVE